MTGATVTHRVFPILGIVAVTLATPLTAEAQALRGALEVRGGWATGNYDLAHAERSHRLGQPAFGALAEVAVLPALSIFGGYSHVRFGCSGGFCTNSSFDFVSRGWDAGIRGGRPDAVWGRVGVTRQTLEVPGSANGAPRDRSRAAIGLTAALGYGIALRENLAVSPGLRYTRYSAGFGEATPAGRVDFLVVDVGVRLRLQPSP